MNRHVKHGTLNKRNILALALATGLGFAGVALGQATTGSIFGQVPAGAGETVVIQNASGLTRIIPVDAKGRYAAGSLPLGAYTVTLKRDGATIDSRADVTLRVGAGTEVSFVGATVAGATTLAGVTVSASNVPSIDVSGVDSRTVITAAQLAKLPLARDAESIALLAPGVVPGSSWQFSGPTGTPLVSFGGSSVTENAYYINGFNTTDPLSGFGGFTLPYGAIDQQEMLSGGYGAAYGRSDGGVINQVGKRGTNEWHFGGQVLWTPAFARGHQNDIHWVNGPQKGELYNNQTDDRSWTTVVSAYAGGPLIKNKLFLFTAVEAERRQGNAIGSTDANTNTRYRNDYPKWYAKLDWNISDNNILEVTGASSKRSYSAELYDYDYASGTTGPLSGDATPFKNGADLYTAKFTSYVTDNLTLSALYGVMDGTYYTATNNLYPDTALLYSPSQQNPALNGGSPITNGQTLGEVTDPAHASRNTNLRFDVSYLLGNHTLTAGIDNQTLQDIDDGTAMTSPGYAWEYFSGAPTTPIVGTDPNADPYVAPPGTYPGGATGYYVAKYIRHGGGTARVVQRAQYVEDSWQVSNRWLVKLGLRNDQFTNYNPTGVAYSRLTKPQWAPRVGFTWDVNGDSSFKVYGNAGRYFLALPSTVAMRQAGAPYYTRQYFTYTGLDAQGQPTGLTPIDTSRGIGAPISANGEYGQSKDPHMVTATNLKSEYQDEFIAGFDKKLGDAWVYGVKATYRSLRNAIDDYGDPGAVQAKMDRMGIDRASYDFNSISGAYLFNPGRTNILKVPKFGGGYYSVPFTTADAGFSSGIKRHYYGLDIYLEHPFDGVWMGKIDYLFSRSYGNSEGQVRSDIGQTDVSATVDWDYWQVMDYANGELSNSRRHQIKAYGSYQVTPEWMVSGNMFIFSGAPRSCLGLWGPDEVNAGQGYGDYTHWCYGKPSRPGDAGHNPWQYIVSLSAEYRPLWAGKKLAFSGMIYNVLNDRKTVQTRARAGSTGAVRANYMMPITQSQPRYVRLGVSYDF